MKKIFLMLGICMIAISSCTQQTKQADAIDTVAVDEEIAVVAEEYSDALCPANLEKGIGKFLMVNEEDGYLSELKFKNGVLSVSYVKGDASTPTLAGTYDYEVNESKLILKKNGETKYEIPIEWEIVKPDGETTCFAFEVKTSNLPEYMAKGKYWDAKSMTM